ncbi:hypothetical protein [Legionella oakridgensis]|uniref:hypothetical protein n=1 Tax=Legionella oakridgensis TaxID=29423 RepID=UPI0003DE45A7|nr:hypothetical protein [Legionella oakridgensis]ETO93424.1 hypothetical protein LOR_27c02220 [Legionella oakridgensis RV-2-2007]
MISIGDILLKIDIRARYAPGFNTQHHAMLVCDIQQGHPVVAHMKFTDFAKYTGHLVIEPCPAAKDVVVIHCPLFSEALRAEIAAIAYEAAHNNVLRIEKEFLETEYHEANDYCSLNLSELRKKHEALSHSPTDVLTEKERLISCHDFVLSTIHLACARLSVPIPDGLNLPPKLAWSPLLYASVQADPELEYNVIDRLIPPSTSIIANKPAFFAPQRPQRTTASCFTNQCAIL